MARDACSAVWAVRGGFLGEGSLEVSLSDGQVQEQQGWPEPARASPRGGGEGAVKGLWEGSGRRWWAGSAPQPERADRGVTLCVGARR